MKFGPVHVQTAEGKILGHHIAGEAGRRIFRKGKSITADDITTLLELGRDTVYVAELEPGDVLESDAAVRVAAALAGTGLALTRSIAGRVNIAATRLGILRVDIRQLEQVNESLGLAVATLEANKVVRPEQVVASVKVIPYAVPEEVVHIIEIIGVTLDVDPIPDREVAIILSGARAVQDRVYAAFEGPLRARLDVLNARIMTIAYVPLEDERGEIELADRVKEMAGGGAELIILAGETAIMDMDDILPRAVRRVGGVVAEVGVPVDPGNLLMVAYLGDLPILGAPGCARSRKTNVIDWVLPRLLAGEKLDRRDLIQLGHGGLLEDTSQRPMPRVVTEFATLVARKP